MSFCLKNNDKIYNLKEGTIWSYEDSVSSRSGYVLIISIKNNSATCLWINMDKSIWLFYIRESYPYRMNNFRIIVP